jgi:hypothetical protein
MSGTAPEPAPFDPWLPEPAWRERWWNVVALMVDQLTDIERAEFERICQSEPGTMKVWPVGDYWQLTVGKDDQLLLGTLHSGTFYADTNAGTLN